MTTLDLPKSVDRIDLQMRDGARIIVRRHGNPDGQRLVLSHGNGFATDGYYPFWSLALDHYDIVLFDMRNHGRNPLGDGLDHGYPAFIGDFEDIHQAVTVRWGVKTTIGVFHSMSALTALRAALDGIWLWDALVLIDPPVMPPPGHSAFDFMVEEGRQIAAMTAKRAARFGSPDELARLYARRFPRWMPRAAELVARTVLRRDDAAGDWVLTCPPALESRMYLENGTLEMWPAAGDLARPTLLIGADPHAEEAQATAHCCRALHLDGGIGYATIPNTGHFLQLENPEACYGIMCDFLRDAGVRT